MTSVYSTCRFQRLFNAWQNQPDRLEILNEGRQYLQEYVDKGVVPDDVMHLVLPIEERCNG